jgi:hypothetical protein
MLSWRDRRKDQKVDECGVEWCDDPGVARVLVEISEPYALGNSFEHHVHVLVCQRHVQECIGAKAEREAEVWLERTYGDDWEAQPGVDEDARWDEAFAAIGYTPGQDEEEDHEEVDLTGASILFGPLLDPERAGGGLNWEGAAAYREAKEEREAPPDHRREITHGRETPSYGE